MSHGRRHDSSFEERLLRAVFETHECTDCGECIDDADRYCYNCGAKNDNFCVEVMADRHGSDRYVCTPQDHFDALSEGGEDLFKFCAECGFRFVQ